MEFFVSEEAPGRFVWGLRDVGGEVIAKSTRTFADRDSAIEAAEAIALALPGADIEGE